MSLRNVTLEMSLKPFGDPSPESRERVLGHLFRQWDPLTRRAEMISVLLWTADGSEILDYAGRLEDTFEWCQWLGTPRSKHTWSKEADPKRVSIHSRTYVYMADPPAMTYGWLRELCADIKRIGTALTGLPVRVGATFDPGPEFAISAFKYERHPEICTGATMGAGSMVCCYGKLHADQRPYAGFLNGIPEGTTMGAFLGRQSQCFMDDLGFDYLWLSNGFGFGLETWGVKGAVFDGTAFLADRCNEVRDLNLGFWQDFRAECPGYPLETRGTNLSTGMDLASDAVPLRDIYRAGFNLEPPPNSPWAAINYDFGQEMVGWMSHIAEIPGDTFPFRFYTHDPWWINSPWLDRYGREAYDIYLPLSVSHVNAQGRTCTPDSILFLTVDDSFGQMPDCVPNEVVPHLLKALEHRPDAPGPLVWLYPFDEYHDMTYEGERISEVFFGDWFMRGAVNNGLPLNTVVSTAVFAAAGETNAERYRESVLITPVPAVGETAEGLKRHLRMGGKVLFYGPIEHADPELLQMLNLSSLGPLSGMLEMALTLADDGFRQSAPTNTLIHSALLSGGGVSVVFADSNDPATELLATLMQGVDSRVGVSRRSAPDWAGGIAVYVRGTVACDDQHLGGHLLIPLKPDVSYPGEALMRLALQAFGLRISSERFNSSLKPPMMTVNRHRNGFIFSGFCADTTAQIKLRFLQGAPVLCEREAILEDGCSVQTMPKTWHHECRIFAEQDTVSHVSCKERTSEMPDCTRRLLLTGCREATVRFYAVPGSEESVAVLLNPKGHFLAGDEVESVWRDDANGRYLEIAGVDGPLSISWAEQTGVGPQGVNLAIQS